MNYETLFSLKSNPFRLVPSVLQEEIVWAGFSNVKLKIQNRIIQTLKISNSGIVLNWGEYGSGKTHAARYFSSRKVLSEIAQKTSCTEPFTTIINLPKGKNPVKDIFTSIIDRIDINLLRSKFASNQEELNSFVDSIIDNNHIRNVLKCIFTSTADSSLLKRYLYDSITQTELKDLRNFEVLREMQSDSDYITLLAGLFSCLTYNKTPYSAIILWIDEFEDIAIQNSSIVDRTNNLLRELIDNAPNNLMIFINLTQTALLNSEDLVNYLSSAVISRIKDTINFEVPTVEDLFTYLNELLNNPLFRTSKNDNNYFPFTKSMIETMYKDLRNPSLRIVNEALSLLLELAENEKVSIIDDAFYQNNKKEIIGWNI